MIQASGHASYSVDYGDMDACLLLPATRMCTVDLGVVGASLIQADGATPHSHACLGVTASSTPLTASPVPPTDTDFMYTVAACVPSGCSEAQLNASADVAALVTSLLYPLDTVALGFACPATDGAHVCVYA